MFPLCGAHVLEVVGARAVRREKKMSEVKRCACITYGGGDTLGLQLFWLKGKFASEDHMRDKMKLKEYLGCK